MILAQWDGLGEGLAVDRNGIVYVATRASIARYTSTGTALPAWPDPDYPDGVAVDGAGNVFLVGAYPSNLVKKLAHDGAVLTSWGSYGTGAGQFDSPTRAAVDPSGNVYVVDYGNNRVEIFSNDGAYLGQFGGTGSGPGQFAGPIGIATDANGFIYVADANNNRIQKFGPLPTPTRTSSWGQLKVLYH
ncbi:MAG: 6-bladed beta-propeller [Candidatus Eiseniibacteriota bacterium]